MKYFKLLLLLYFAELCCCAERNLNGTLPTPISEAELNLPGKPPDKEQDPNEHTILREIDVRELTNASIENLRERDMEDLTPRAYTSLFNRSEIVDEDDGEPGYDAKHDKWEVTLQKIKGTGEWMSYRHHVGSHREKLISCYFIGVTYKHAVEDIKAYYKLRYLYTNNRDYEIGYLVEEIIVHYEIAVELYHLMMVKYGAQRDRYLTPVTYMFYMYTNILYQCKTILHLCNMLHEIENKYKQHPDTVFMDYHLPSTGAPFKSPFDENKMKKFEEEFLKEQKRKQKEKKRLFKAGVFTTRTRRPKKGPFELHYGWSIEYWY